jgi:hypothetical protein
MKAPEGVIDTCFELMERRKDGSPLRLFLSLCMRAFQGGSGTLLHLLVTSLPESNSLQALSFFTLCLANGCTLKREN